MSNFDPDLENELRGLHPVAPSPHLAVKIGRDLRASPTPAWTPAVRASLWASWSLTAAAASLAVVAWWPSTPAAAAPPLSAPAVAESTAETGIVPVATSNLLTEATDEGIVLLDDGRPARRLRLHFVDTVQWRDEDARTDIAVSRPREEVRFMPVNFH